MVEAAAAHSSVYRGIGNQRIPSLLRRHIGRGHCADVRFAHADRRPQLYLAIFRLPHSHPRKHGCDGNDDLARIRNRYGYRARNRLGGAGMAARNLLRLHRFGNRYQYFRDYTRCRAEQTRGKEIKKQNNSLGMKLSNKELGCLVWKRLWNQSQNTGLCERPTCQQSRCHNRILLQHVYWESIYCEGKRPRSPRSSAA